MIVKKSVLISVPYFFSIALTVILGIVFSENVVFNVSSVIVIAFLFVQAVIMISRDVTSSVNMSGGELSEKEAYFLCKTIAHATLLFIPIIFPFVIFFSENIAAVVSVSVWLMTFFLGFIVFRLRYGNEIKKRIRKEDAELMNQLKREEQGKL